MTDDQQVLRWRMHSQFGEAVDDVAGIARRSAGIQAQDAPAVRLALRARGLIEAAAVPTGYRDGVLVASWLMRTTLHLVPAEDLGWLLALFRDRNLAATARRRRDLGLTEQLCRDALAALPGLLTTPLSRAGLVAALREAGIPVPAEGQAPAHLTLYAAAHGVLCRGADVAPREPGYVPVPPGRELGADEALSELAARYAAAFGPVAPADFAAWSGLTKGDAHRAFSLAGLVETAAGLAVTPGAVPPPAGPPLVRLLGPYDTYLLGYHERELMLDPAYARRINAGGGVIKPALAVDGRIAGTWRRERGALVVEPFERLAAEVRAAVAGEIADIGRFLGEELEPAIGS